MVKIVVTRRAAVSLPAVAKIVIEGTAVLEDLDVPRACALMMGLIYALNLSYPKQVQNILWFCDIYQVPKLMFKNKQICKNKLHKLHSRTCCKSFLEMTGNLYV